MKNLINCLFIFQFAISFAQTYEVGHTTITFNDPSRTGGFGSGAGTGRQIQTEIYYPADVAGEDVALTSGEFPVIVFGHGFAMSWDAYENIWSELVPKGYIIAFPRTEGGLFPAPSHEEFGKDLALLVTKMNDEGALASSLFYNGVSGKTALVGHSMGGGASFLAAENNTEITTVIGMAPAETTPSAISAASNVTVPALVFTADGDAVTPPADNHLPIYTGLGSSCKYLIDIIGGAHCYYANASTTCDFGESTSGGNITITRQDQHAIVFRYLIPWIDLYLKDDCSQRPVFETELNTDADVNHQSSCTGFPSPSYDLNISVSGAVLTSDQTNTTYQWVDCDDNNSAIIGANSQSFTAAVEGNYAVLLGDGSCQEITNCVNISFAGLEDMYLNQADKKVVQIVDFMGRETELKSNTPLILIYSDGSRQRVFNWSE